jgi:hypothetical protein
MKNSTFRDTTKNSLYVEVLLMEISRYELKRDLNNYYTLVIYLDPLFTEFSTELGETQLKKDDFNIYEL